MAEHNKTFNWLNILISAAAVVIIFAGIYLAQSVIVLLLASIFLALIGTPAVLWFKSKKIPTIISVAIVVFVMIMILLMIGFLVGTSLKSFSDALPFYQLRLQQQFAALELLLTKTGIIVTDKTLLNYINPDTILNLTANLFTVLSSAFSNIVLILLTVTFILLEVSSFPVKLRAVLGNPEAVFPRFARFVIDIRHYLVITTLINLTAGILIWLWLSILGVKYPILWAFLVFLLHYIPNIGSIIAAVPAVLLAFIQLGLSSALLVAAGYFLVGFILGNIVQPKLMGRRLGLSTLVVFLSLIFWGNLLGLAGAVLCIPLTMTLKFAFESSETTNWIAVLIGPEKTVQNKNMALKKKKKKYE
jgi:AI-2 transport protein TqsA